jgi:hypothetical protein
MARKTSKQTTKQTTIEPAAVVKAEIIATPRAELKQAPGALAPVAIPVTAAKTAAARADSKIKVPFVLLDLGAKEVLLSGEFNGWSQDGMPMKRHQNGHWEATMALNPGRYQYKFIVDGQWMPDPLARENVVNEHGTLNSVVEVQA